MMVVWITGASSGLGLHTAAALQKAGMTVVSGARSFKNHEGKSDCGHRLQLDVTDAASCAAFCRKAFALYGAPDALCCCAGVLTLGACEDYTDAELFDVLNTNFLGMVRVIRRVLPLLREKGLGKIVLFSSVNGVLGIPFQGAYTAAKHAVEGFAESLRMEVKPFGVSVCVVEPGDHRGGSDIYRRHAEHTDGHSPYAAAYRSAVAKIAHDEQQGSDPDKLGLRIAHALQKKRLPCKLIIASPSQRLAVLLHKLLPTRLFARIIRSYYVSSKT